ncbi:MAG: head-tail connector protein [Pseudomonadota bacterium]
MALTLITAAASLPVSLAAVRAYCRVEDNRFDSVLDPIRKGAIGHIERMLGRAIGEQTWQLSLTAFSDVIELQRWPVLNLVEDGFSYIDPDGAPQLVDADTYTLDALSNPAAIVRNNDARWPQVIDRPNAITIEFVAGWTETTLPHDLQIAVCMIAQAWFDGETGKIPAAAMDLLHAHRVLRI